MGQGITFCLHYNCRMNHRSAKEVLSLLDARLFVAQSKTQAFLKASISSEFIDNEVVEKWLSTSQTLQDWSRTFRLAKMLWKMKLTPLVISWQLVKVYGKFKGV